MAELTLRERQVLGLLSVGMRYPRICRALGISVHTARNHVKRAIKQLECPNGYRTILGAVVRAIA